MNRFRFFIPLVFTLMLLCACIYRRPVTFSQATDGHNAEFFSEIPRIAKEKNYLGADATIKGDIRFYRITYHERQVENGNVIDYSNVPADSLAVPYLPLAGGTYQELYLAEIPTTDTSRKVFVYYSLNYNAGMQVVGFGPAYLGQLVKCPNDIKNSQIEFYAALKSKRKSPYVLKKTNELTDIKFVLKNYHDNDSCIAVSRIIEANPNKIGGSRPLVFNTDSILGRNRLNFIQQR